MNPFDYHQVAEAAAVPARLSAAVRPLAGGTDLLTRLKAGLDQPDALVDLKASDLGWAIDRVDGGWRLGALVTLSRIQDHPGLRADVPALIEAVSQAATPQLRNRATIAGNLLQRPRCGYFRHPGVQCWLAGGEGCPARTGRNEHHAVFDTDGPCVATHPSDPAAALTALGATVTVLGGNGERELAVADLLRAPTEDRRVEHVLADDAVITAVTVPSAPRSTYLKAMDRAVWAFALVGVAAAMSAADGEVRLVASGVANTPWRLAGAEAALAGTGLTPDAIDRAAAAATDGAAPLAENGYKLPLLRALTHRALTAIA
ncbi:MAG: FAD binding domain-containing protein [Acidimicrobiales bacterium]